MPQLYSKKKKGSRKARRTKIADSIEYLFLDGARPDDRQAAREAKEVELAQEKQKLENKKKKQDDIVEEDKSVMDKIEDKYKDPAMYQNRGDQYKNYTEDEYAREAKRQQEIFNKTGKWDWRNAPKK